MYQYTSVPPPHSFTYLYTLPHLHNLAARSYDTTYMSRPYAYTEPRRYNSYYETSYSRPSTSHQPVQTDTWRHVRPAQAPQADRVPRKSSLKKTASRHVRFDLPPAHGTSSRTTRLTEEERQRELDRTRARERERECEREQDVDRHRHQESRYYMPPRPPLRHHPPSESMPRKHHSSYTSTYEYDSHHHQEQYHRTSLPRSNSTYTRLPPPPQHQPPFQPRQQSPPPTRPTVYIITYATDNARSESTITSLLATQVPRRYPPIPHLYTIDARHVRPPSPELCREYSGVSPLIQDIVMEDGEARRAAARAVRELLRFGGEERRGRGGRSVEVSMSVCCHSGTHRSVAIAERIAQVVKSEVGRMGCEEGVRVVCRHVHRVKGRKDPF
ncbi:hypothetical protein G6011_08237 [Alternaria panax]|uniref:RapZ C-terminal domain-containing protein n=1 Tax=Alternaria panax TaxID=48097 RepID=A0AAD4FGK8_9PLEO|nr:hypothetical protein G6011_08237 [Alternaria panax]